MNTAVLLQLRVQVRVLRDDGEVPIEHVLRELLLDDPRDQLIGPRIVVCLRLVEVLRYCYQLSREDVALHLGLALQEFGKHQVDFPSIGLEGLLLLRYLLDIFYFFIVERERVVMACLVVDVDDGSVELIGHVVEIHEIGMGVLLVLALVHALVLAEYEFFGFALQTLELGD